MSWRGTSKQLEIMNLVLAAADAGALLDPKTLHGALSYGSTCSLAAIYCSLEFLEKHGFIEKVRVGLGKRLKPTTLAYHVLRPESFLAKEDPEPASAL